MSDMEMVACPSDFVLSSWSDSVELLISFASLIITTPLSFCSSPLPNTFALVYLMTEDTHLTTYLRHTIILLRRPWSWVIITSASKVETSFCIVRKLDTVFTRKHNSMKNKVLVFDFLIFSFHVFAFQILNIIKDNIPTLKNEKSNPCCRKTYRKCSARNNKAAWNNIIILAVGYIPSC